MLQYKLKVHVVTQKQFLIIQQNAAQQNILPQLLDPQLFEFRLKLNIKGSDTVGKCANEAKRRYEMHEGVSSLFSSFYDKDFCYLSPEDKIEAVVEADEICYLLVDSVKKVNSNARGNLNDVKEPATPRTKTTASEAFEEHAQKGSTPQSMANPPPSKKQATSVSNQPLTITQPKVMESIGTQLPSNAIFNPGGGVRPQTTGTPATSSASVPPSKAERGNSRKQVLPPDSSALPGALVAPTNSSTNSSQPLESTTSQQENVKDKVDKQVTTSSKPSTPSKTNRQSRTKSPPVNPALQGPNSDNIPTSTPASTLVPASVSQPSDPTKEKPNEKPANRRGKTTKSTVKPTSASENPVLKQQDQDSNAVPESHEVEAKKKKPVSKKTAPKSSSDQKNGADDAASASPMDTSSGNVKGQQQQQQQNKLSDTNRLNDSPLQPGAGVSSSKEDHQSIKHQGPSKSGPLNEPNSNGGFNLLRPDVHVNERNMSPQLVQPAKPSAKPSESVPSPVLPIYRNEGSTGSNSANKEKVDSSSGSEDDDGDDDDDDDDDDEEEEETRSRRKQRLSRAKEMTASRTLQTGAASSHHTASSIKPPASVRPTTQSTQKGRSSADTSTTDHSLKQKQLVDQPNSAQNQQGISSQHQLSRPAASTKQHATVLSPQEEIADHVPGLGGFESLTNIKPSVHDGGKKNVGPLDVLDDTQSSEEESDSSASEDDSSDDDDDEDEDEDANDKAAALKKRKRKGALATLRK